MKDIFIAISKRNRFLFLFAIFLFSLIGPIVADQLPVPSGTDPSHASRLNNLSLYFVALFLAPVIETGLLQSFPAIIARSFLNSYNSVFLIVTLPFILLHFIPSAPLPSLINGIAGGVSLGACYVTYMQKSHFYAFFTTVAIHSAHNAVVLTILT